MLGNTLQLCLALTLLMCKLLNSAPLTQLARFGVNISAAVRWLWLWLTADAAATCYVTARGLKRAHMHTDTGAETTPAVLSAP